MPYKYRRNSTVKRFAAVRNEEMKTIAHKNNLKNPRILELIIKLQELELRMKKTQELFFDMNLKSFKKFAPDGGK